MRFEVRPGVRRLFRLPTRTRDARRRDARERERHMHVVELLESLLQDVAHAARGLARRPAFTAAAVLTLAIGVGATTAIFSAVDALLWRPLPYARPHELMQASLVLPAEGERPALTPGFAYPTYVAFRDAQRSFQAVAAYTPTQATLTSGDVERVDGEYVSASYLRTLGLVPERGRDFDRSLDAPGGAPADAIISHGLWERRFGADPSAIGRTIELDRKSWTIVGVGPREFRGLSGQADVFLPVASVASELARPGTSMLSVVARRAAGVTASRAAAEASTLGGRLANEFPNLMGNRRWEVRASTLDALRLDPLVRRWLLLLFGATWLVLGIACVNVACLFLGRARARRRELAVRAAMGAGRGRVVRLLLVESVVVALLGGAASAAVAWVGVRVLASVDPSAVYRGSRDASTIGAVAFSSIALDWRALAFALAASLAAGLLVGCAPALGAARASISDAIGSGRTTAGAGVGRRALVVTEIAFAFVLLVGSGLMVRSLAKLLTVDVGFDTSNLVTFGFDPSDPSTGESRPGVHSQLLERVRAVPGVADAALGTCAPLALTCRRALLTRPDGPTTGGAHGRGTGLEVVSAGWFRVTRVPLVRGRPLLPTDRPDGPRVALLNETAARTFFGADDPIGRRISLGGAGADVEVVGVVGDVRQLPDSAPGPMTYVPDTQSEPGQVTVFVRTRRDAASVAGELRRAVREVAPQAPVDHLQTTAQRRAVATAQARFRATLLTVFAIAALVLASVGVHGVLAFAVAMRTREIGIRMALGAGRASVQRLVVGEGLALVAAGVAVGMGGALAGARVLRTFLFELTPGDPVTYAVILVVLGATAVLASWVPGLRASRVDPVTALGAE